MAFACGCGEELVSDRPAARLAVMLATTSLMRRPTATFKTSIVPALTFMIPLGISNDAPGNRTAAPGTSIVAPLDWIAPAVTRIIGVPSLKVAPLQLHLSSKKPQRYGSEVHRCSSTAASFQQEGATLRLFTSNVAALYLQRCGSSPPTFGPITAIVIMN